MAVRWMDVESLSFNTLLLLERIQLSWFPGWVCEADLALALDANPVVEWYLGHKCPEIRPWLDGVAARKSPAGADEVRAAETAVMRQINDLLVYVVDPAVYDAQPFLGWDSRELTKRVAFAGKTVVDVGSGTGRLALVAAPEAAVVFAVEPVETLRRTIRDKAAARGLSNVYAVDGTIEAIPFPDEFADVVMGGHVFGEVPEVEIAEVERVTRRGGTMIACPGNGDADNETHAAFVRHGFQWERFDEPQDGTKRKYWAIKGSAMGER